MNVLIKVVEETKDKKSPEFARDHLIKDTAILKHTTKYTLLLYKTSIQIC
jgi:hypothetical protein